MTILYKDEAESLAGYPTSDHSPYDEAAYQAPPLDTPTQRALYMQKETAVSMGRHHAAAVIETIATDHEKITQYDAVVDAMYRLWGNSSEDDVNLYTETQKGFLHPFDRELAKEVLVNVAYKGQKGHWPSVPNGTLNFKVTDLFMHDWEAFVFSDEEDGRGYDEDGNYFDKYQTQFDALFEPLKAAAFASALATFLSDDQKIAVIDRLQKIQLAMRENEEPVVISTNTNVFGAAAAKELIKPDDPV